ncbi:MAG TPA: hypothetical protein VH518_05050, partial [Tepidisphaeraceae bacterium]
MKRAPHRGGWVLVNCFCAAVVAVSIGLGCPIARAGVGANSFSTDFNALTPGDLVGQDGWTLGASPSPVLQAGGGVNPTLAPSTQAPQNASATIRGAVHAGGGVGGSLGAGGLAGRFLTFDIDARSSSSGDWSMFGPGRRIVSGHFPNFAFAFYFGVEGSSVWMSREQTGQMAAAQFSDIKPTYDTNDWYQVRMTVDLAANGGNGAGSLFIRDLTDGEASLIPAPGCQNINLQLLTSPVPDPLKWDGLGILFNTGFGATGAVDNLNYVA